MKATNNRLLELETFVNIVDAGSITAAADHLDIAKSAVSRRLRDLETRLGVQLLKRTTRRQSLTESGRSFYERSVRILDDLAEAEQTVSEEHCQLAGTLRVAAPLSFGMLHLSSAIDDFSKQHPDVDFDLDLNDRQVDILQDGFDLAIRIAKLEDSSLIARRIATTAHVVCASPDYLEAHGKPLQPEDLARHQCLVYGNAPTPGRWDFRTRDGVAVRLDVPIHLKASSGDFLAEMARRGQGVVMEPDFIVYRAIEAGHLVPLLRDVNWPELGIYAVYPPTRFLSRRVLEFIEFLTERFHGTPYWQRCLEREGPD